MSIQQLNRLSHKIRSETENFVKKIQVTPKQFCRIILHPLKTGHRVPALITSITLGLLSVGFIHAGCAITNAVMRKKGHWKSLQPQNNKPPKAVEKANNQPPKAVEKTNGQPQSKPKESSPSTLFSSLFGKSAPTSQPAQQGTAPASTPPSAPSNPLSWFKPKPAKKPSAAPSTSVPAHPAAPSAPVHPAPASAPVSSAGNSHKTPPPAPQPQPVASAPAAPVAPAVPPVPQALAPQEHYDQWLKLWKEGDELQALQHLEKAAQKDHPQAKLKWAEMYFRGHVDSKKKPDEVFGEIAGVVDSAEPQVKREMAEALIMRDFLHLQASAETWMRSAADAGDALAQHKVAVMEFENCDDLDEAKRQFAEIEARANRGDKYACEYVGGKYVDGFRTPYLGLLVVPEDLMKAKGYIDKAFEQKMPEAMILKIVLLYHSRNGSAKEQQALTILNLQGDIDELLQQAELIEDPKVLAFVGFCYNSGKIATADEEKSIKLLEKAHRLHSKEATKTLAEIFADKTDHTSLEKALTYLYVLERRGDGDAPSKIERVLYALVDAYGRGNGPDKQKVFEYLDICNQRDLLDDLDIVIPLIQSCAKTALDYWSGNEVDQDLAKAEQFLQQTVAFCTQNNFDLTDILPPFSIHAQKSSQQLLEWVSGLSFQEDLTPIIAHIHAAIGNNYWKGINGYPRDLEEAKKHILLAKDSLRGKVLHGLMSILDLIEPIEGVDAQALDQRIREDIKYKQPVLDLEDILLAYSLFGSRCYEATGWLRCFARTNSDIKAYSLYFDCKSGYDEEQHLRELASSDNGTACYLLSELYSDGAVRVDFSDEETEIIAKNPELASQFLDQAVQHNIPAALVAKAKKLLEAKQSDEQVIALLQTANQAGCAEALYVMAQQNQLGLYAEAAKLGSLNAIRHLAKLYWNEGHLYVSKTGEAALKYNTILVNCQQNPPMQHEDELRKLAYQCGMNRWKGPNKVRESLPIAIKHFNKAIGPNRDNIYDEHQRQAAIALAVLTLFNPSIEDQSAIAEAMELIQLILSRLDDKETVDLIANILPVIPAIYREGFSSLLRNRYNTETHDAIAAFDCMQFLKAGKKDDFVDAFNMLKRIADNNDVWATPHPIAWLHLSQRYFNGVTLNGAVIVQKDQQQGWDYLTKAITTENPNEAIKTKANVIAAERILAGDLPPQGNPFASIDPIKTLRDAMQAQDAHAAYLLAKLYETGNQKFKVQANSMLALTYFEAASSWGHLEATRGAANLHLTLEDGNHFVGFGYYHVLARLGDGDAYQFVNGHTATPDPMEDLVQRAQVDPKAMRQLSLMYLKGIKGAPRLDDAGRFYLRNAVNAHDPEAYIESQKMALFDSNHYATPPKETLEELMRFVADKDPETRTLAALLIIKIDYYNCLNPQLMDNVNWFTRAFDVLRQAGTEGNQQAQVEIARINFNWAQWTLDEHDHPEKYQNPRTIPTQYVEGRRQLLVTSKQTLDNLASQNQPHACLVKARFIHEKKMESTSPREDALFWVEKTLSQDTNVTPEALVLKANIIADTDREEAIKLLEQALDLGYEEAAFELSQLIADDDEKSKQLLATAAKWGSVQAHWELAQTGWRGTGNLELLRKLGHSGAEQKFQQQRQQQDHDDDF